MSLIQSIDRYLQSDTGEIEDQVIDDQSFYPDENYSFESVAYDYQSQQPSTFYPRQTCLALNQPPVQLSNATVTTLSKSKIPEKFRHVFNFQYFNKMQSEAFQDLFNTGSNCIVSAPTGSGKTVLFELAIIKLLISKSMEYQNLRNAKVLYMAPTKALCTERHQDWQRKFSSLGISVGLLTSDTNSLETDSVKRSDIIICTPEKWDVLSRRWFDYEKLLELVQLLLVDEIHTLKEKRGTILEVVVTRMKRMNQNLRIIAVSATIPNIEDLSLWLRNSTTTCKVATVLKFDEEYRSVKLNKIVYGYKTGGSATNTYQFDVFLNGKLVEVLKLHSKSKPVIIFCPTRNQCISTAKFLESKMHEIYRDNSFPIVQTSNRELQHLLNSRVAYHHAGLSFDERKQIEEGFKTGALKVLCSTTTLAVGVNLPAYCVIIKGTKAWTNGSFDEYSEIDILQMLGRAGRPQFENEGCVIIMTDYENKIKYERFVKGTEKLESSLHLHLAEHIASEILLGTITDLETGLDWLKSTFFYQRFLRNPTAYPSVSKEISGGNPSLGCSSLEERLLRFCEIVINRLIAEKLVHTENGKYKCTSFGMAMCRHYIFIETVKLFLNCSQRCTLLDLLKLLSRSDEFNEIRLKYHERKLFREINQNPLVKFQCENKKLERDEDKISLIIQYELGGLTFPVYQGSMKLHQVFLSDKFYVFKQSPRILKAAIDIFTEKKDSKSLLSALQLYRCMAGKCWENSPMILRQLSEVGLASVRKFANANVFNFKDLINLPRDKIEYYLGLRPGGATKIINAVKKIPLSFLNLQYVSHRAINTQLATEKNYVEVTIAIEIGLMNPSDAGYIWNNSSCFVNVVTQVASTGLQDFRRLPIRKLKESSKRFQLSIKLYSVQDQIDVFLNFDDLAGMGQVKSWSLTTDLPKTIDFNSVLAGLKQNKELLNLSLDDSLSEFGSSDDDLLDQIFNSVKVPDSKVSPIAEPKPMLNEELTKDNDESPDTTFTQKHSSRLTNGNYKCNHLCKDRMKCRHLCCKEGIPKPKNSTKISGEKCLHSCRDKLSCRHLCCRESIGAKFDRSQSRYSQSKLDCSPLIPSNLVYRSPLQSATRLDMTLPSLNMNQQNQGGLSSVMAEIDIREDLNDEQKALFKTMEKVDHDQSEKKKYELNSVGFNSNRKKYVEALDNMVVSRGLAEEKVAPLQISAEVVDTVHLPSEVQKVNSTKRKSFSSASAIAMPSDLIKVPSNPFQKRPRDKRTKRQKLLIDLEIDGDEGDWGSDDFSSTISKITMGSTKKGTTTAAAITNTTKSKDIVIDFTRRKFVDATEGVLYDTTDNNTMTTPEGNTTAITLSTDVAQILQDDKKPDIASSRIEVLSSQTSTHDKYITVDSLDQNLSGSSIGDYDELALLLGSDIEIV